jgi:hypothetical protein
MKTTGILRSIVVSITLFVVALLAPTGASAHCDGMDGPVVKAAQRALESGNVNTILIWVQKKDEGEVRRAFEKTLTVRKLSPEAKDLADMYFFETVVRLHRAGEGAPYTGLKPAGRDLGPAIPAADRALENRSVEPLLKLVGEKTREGIREHFKEASGKANFDKNDLDAGREYVKAYVEFVHYVERLYEAARNPVHGHYLESDEASMHEAEN